MASIIYVKHDTPNIKQLQINIQLPQGRLGLASTQGSQVIYISNDIFKRLILFVSLPLASCLRPATKPFSSVWPAGHGCAGVEGCAILVFAPNQVLHCQMRRQSIPEAFFSKIYTLEREFYFIQNRIQGRALLQQPRRLGIKENT